MSDYPLGYPLASNASSESPLADRPQAQELAANDGAPRGTTPTQPRHRAHITTAIICDIDRQLSDRDRAILRSVSAHQFLTVRQIRILHFAELAPTSGRRTAKRVLARLRDLRVLGAMAQRVGGVRAGSDGLVHYVDVAGERLLNEQIRRSRKHRHEPTARFVSHRLAVADAHIGLIGANRDNSIELIDSAVEPVAWRTFTGLGAARRTLKPDLFAETATHDGLVRAWFIEIDLSTESVPTLLTKCREYEAYRQTGVEQDRHGSFPLVVWSMTHPDLAKAERRRHALADAIDKDRNLPNALFRIVTPEGLLPLIQNGDAQ
ncbi:replication-relaxation family protein [Mycobacterium sp. CVI_P3]|uniref:Replication-relaxation family protein n=1 Tax=Mycobacterium pinniadriaticum TaxID=2994102 RepID=A0ABT3SPL8_9MYCO|nr:replication-relaxation family protein [Mycobacterium pinniadriaticum]MCX2934672.1 replication-relaxation family protein [Mycobacterium pinniadriaticum]MCX2941094.1 replication-relaxation family protein [Mycobacterium pinniadriaticum]